MRYIDLTQGYRALVDDEDYERLSKYSYFSSPANGVNRALRSEYIQRRKRTINMSRDVLRNYDMRVDIDHINGNPLDNRKCNLRVATRSQNRMNSIKRKDASSIYKGVSVVPGAKNPTWVAYIHIDGKKHHLGTFKDERKAARAYNKAATEAFGEFARLNVIRRKKKSTSNLFDNNKDPE